MTRSCDGRSRRPSARPRDSLDHHPVGEQVVVVAEIADGDASLARTKAAVYARAGVPVYWLLDIPARRLAVYTEPKPQGEYALTRVLGDDEAVALPELEGVTLPVAEMLP